ncbi:hypothetical protein L1049_004290 [Liquidambar formosana]|uniref:Uncharacterized protein n=1 Tax=Liquidambar formosana TaxID=63359 RepID=A0AAP0RT32_LIQFO
MIRALAKKDAQGRGGQANITQNRGAGAELGGMTSEDQENYYQSCFHFFQMLRNMIRGGTTKEGGDIENPRDKNPGNQSTNGSQGRQLFPSNYDSCYESIKLISKAMLVILGFGYTNAIRKLRNKKEKHTWSVQIMNELLQSTSTYEYEYDGKNPDQTLPLTHKDDETTAYSTILEDQQKPAEPTTPILIAAKNGVTEKGEKFLELFPVAIHDMNSDKKNIVLLAVEEQQPAETAKETPILIAAKNGVTEMVEKILELFPVAIHDMNSDGKNIVLLAVENRQPHIYQLLVKQNILKDTTLRTVDNRGNSALHLAATLGEYTPWLIPGAALQMQWEIKWYEIMHLGLKYI